MDLTTLKQRFGIIGNNEALNEALEVAMRVAPTDLSVLITGERVSGKRVFRRLSMPTVPGNTAITLQ